MLLYNITIIIATKPHACVHSKSQNWYGLSCNMHIELSLFSFFSTYFSLQQFFFSLPIFLNILLIIWLFSNHYAIFFSLVYLRLLSMHDCCIRKIHNMVTALLEYICFPMGKCWANPVYDHSIKLFPPLQCKIG